MMRTDTLARLALAAVLAGCPGVAWPQSNETRAGAVRSDSKGEPHVLRFLNGDVIRGELVSIDRQAGLKWRHPQAAELITFALDRLDEVALPGPRADDAPGGGTSRVRLTNGDELRGDVVELSEKRLTLDTPYGGLFQIERPMVLAIFPGLGEGQCLYEGPNAADEWKVTAGVQNARVRYIDRAYALEGFGGCIGRDLELPDRASFEFDAAWNGMMQLYVLLYTDNLQTPEADAYSLRIEGYRVHLYRQTRAAGYQHLGTAELPELQNRTSVAMCMLVDRAKHEFALRVDGQLAKQWKDVADFPGPGRGVLFQCKGSTTVRVGGFRVCRWDGNLNPVADEEAAPTTDVMELTNADRVSGRLESIRKGRVTLRTDYGAFGVPLERVEFVRLRGTVAGLARRNAGDIQAFFRSGGRLSLDLKSVDGSIVAGSSENFGDAAVRLGALSRLRFNIYEPRAELGATPARPD